MITEWMPVNSPPQSSPQSNHPLRIVVSASPTFQRGLAHWFSTQMPTVGLHVLISTGSCADVESILRTTIIHQLVTSTHTWQDLLPHAIAHTIPLLCIATTFCDALRITGSVTVAPLSTPIGIILDDEATLTPETVASVLEALQRGENAVPSWLYHPFRDSALSPQRQSYLTLRAQGIPPHHIAQRMRVSHTRMRKYWENIRAVLEITTEVELNRWIEDWWHTFLKHTLPRSTDTRVERSGLITLSQGQCRYLERLTQCRFVSPRKAFRAQILLTAANPAYSTIRAVAQACAVWPITVRTCLQTCHHGEIRYNGAIPFAHSDEQWPRCSDGQQRLGYADTR